MKQAIIFSMFAGFFVFLGVVCYFFAPSLRAIDNTIDYAVHKVDEATNYELKQEVEDSCRAMIASYESDKQTYEQYKDSDSTEKQSWAEQARMRANRTASTYNNYMLKNSYVWSNNVPMDIRTELEAI